MKLFKSTYQSIAFILLSFIVLSSCKKESENQAKVEKTAVIIKISGADTQVETNNKKSLSMQDQNQFTVFNFDADHRVLATLSSQKGEDMKVNPRALSQNPKAATAIRTPLFSGTSYYIAVYKTSGEYVLHQQYIYAPGQDPKIDLSPGTYTFISVASGTNTLPNINFNQPLSQVDFSVSDASTDVMYFKQDMTVQVGVQNNLDVVLRHLFTQVVLTINTAQIGDVVSIGAASISPNLSSATISMQDGSLSYPSTAAVAAKSFTFTNTTGQSIVSNPIYIFPSNTTTGSVTIANFQIGTIAKPLTFSNLTLTDGIKYNLDFRLLAVGINIGYEVWSAGNLIYDTNQGRYGFTLSDNDYGNYWFYNHLLPKKLDGTNQGPDALINGGPGDPCAKVLPEGTWRLPSENDVDQLLTHTGPNGVDNPHNVNTWDPARFVDYFDGAGSGTNLGMFFGTQNNPGVRRHDYLYFVYAGAYHNENTQGPTIGHEGNYLLTGTSGGYREFHMTGASGDIGYGASIGQADEFSAYQIRCVKN
ncbi:hypothetical protein [Sphingobacterium sp.]|uniref:hypothetical protein n=1 Tax=Sphingobacterium sp. TaxID=341027 RepID=UPI0031D1EC33